MKHLLFATLIAVCVGLVCGCDPGPAPKPGDQPSPVGTPRPKPVKTLSEQ